MIKKISIILFVLAVLVTGYLSFRKLNYWERSVMIFKYDSSQQFNRGRGGRGFGDFERREGRPQRPEGVNIPDSIRRRSEGRGSRDFNRSAPGRDSLRVTREGGDRVFPGRGELSGGLRGMDRRNGGDFRRGQAINLNMVIYYLGVFALFTLIMVYLEKGYRLIFKQKKLSQENKDLII
jgi:hypothetical protein